MLIYIDENNVSVEDLERILKDLYTQLELVSENEDTIKFISKRLGHETHSI